MVYFLYLYFPIPQSLLNLLDFPLHTSEALLIMVTDDLLFAPGETSWLG